MSIATNLPSTGASSRAAASWLLLALLLASTAAFAQAPDELLRVRVHASPAALELLDECGAEILAQTASSAEVSVSAADLEEFSRSGLPWTVLERHAKRPGKPPGYIQTYAEMIQQMQMLTAGSPIATVVNVSQLVNQPPTAGGQNLHAVKISDNAMLDEDEVNVMIVAAHHANEIVTPEIVLYAIKQFVEGYLTDPRIKAMVDEYEIWLAPVWNPDGYDADLSMMGYGRLNKNQVNLNRNYPIGWAGRCGGPPDLGHGNYRGPSAGSEIETKTMMAWSKARRFAKVLDFHTRGRQVLWGYAPSCHQYPAKFTTWIEREAGRIHAASDWTQALDCRGAPIRPPSADGEHQQWQFAKMGAYAHLVETFCVTHQPPHMEALQEAPYLWPLIQYVIERPLSMYGHVRDAYTGMPVEANIKLVGVNFSRGEKNSSGGMFGRYHMTLPPGDYRVRFSAPGYEDQTVPLMVADNMSSTMMDIRMAKPGIPVPPLPPPGVGGMVGGVAGLGMGGGGPVAGVGGPGAGGQIGPGAGGAGTPGATAGTAPVAPNPGAGPMVPPPGVAMPADEGCGCRVALGAAPAGDNGWARAFMGLFVLGIGLWRMRRRNPRKVSQDVLAVRLELIGSAALEPGRAVIGARVGILDAAKAGRRQARRASFPSA